MTSISGKRTILWRCRRNSVLPFCLLSHNLAQTWKYVFSKGYGSPEYSAKSDKVGHNLLEIASVQLLEGGRSLFVEIPKIEPVMLCYLRMHLKDAEGVSFKTDLFASLMYP